MEQVGESYTSGEGFASLPLHDAILHTLCFDWEAGRCVAELEVFVEPGKDAIPRLLIWHRVTEVLAPHQEPWGPSVFIRSGSFDRPSTYVLEMQSGDEIRVIAEGYELVTLKA